MSFTGLECNGPYWLDKGNGLLELNLEMLDILGISRLLSVFAIIWRHLALDKKLKCPWPIEFMPREILDFETTLSIKDRQFAAQISNIDREN